MKVSVSNEISFEFLQELGNNTGYTDHIIVFKELFEIYKPKAFLEWGCGYSSKYFLDHSDCVTSVELISKGMSEEWFFHCKNLLKNYRNWQPILLIGSNACEKAFVYQHSIQKDYALIDPTYFQELYNYTQILNAINKYDVAFVDAGVYVRGDLAEICLLQKIPIVIIHDARSLFTHYPSLEIDNSVDSGLYGWFKIKNHEEYDKLYFDFGQGTMLWINKSLANVFDYLKSKLNMFTIN